MFSSAGLIKLNPSEIEWWNENFLLIVGYWTNNLSQATILDQLDQLICNWTKPQVWVLEKDLTLD